MKEPAPGVGAGAPRPTLFDVALEYHTTIEGEYGCPGASCPGVQRLVTLLDRAVLYSQAAGAHQHLCSTCHGNGVIQLINGVTTCGPCHGTGWEWAAS
jgi:hypothetical protein